MKRLISITDDLTGAADSGSYFTNRGIELTNYTELNPDKITLSSEHNICLLEKSLYTKDPVMPPSQSFIPDILKKGVQYRIECIDIVKGTQMKLVQRVARAVGQDNRVIVFDAITKEAGKRIVSSLAPLYHNAVWTGSLGIADALSWYMSGQDHYEQTAYCENIIGQNKGERSAEKRCACFTASAYDATKRQIEYSMRLGCKK